MTELRPDHEERLSGALHAHNLGALVEAISTDGFAVIADAVDRDHVAILREQMLIDVDRVVNRPDAPFNWVRGNVQQDPPPFPPFLFDDVLNNPFAIQVSTAILGDGFANVFYSGNTAMPSEERQPVHADTGQLWPHLKAPTPPYQLVVNIPLVDMGPENGSTELWPGTHTDPTVTMSGGDIKVRPEVLAARRQIEPPIQPVVSAGSILIRDIRLWHAGMPNRTAAPRPMIAMIHTVPWYSTGNMQFRRDAEPFVRGSRIIHRCEFLDEVDYIRAPSGFEFPRLAAES